MSSYSERETYSQAGHWLLGAVRRNPEALLLMAAGCCLMMRSGSSSSRPTARLAHERDEWNYPAGEASSQVRRASASAREGLSRVTDAASDTAESAGDYASQVKDRLTEKASDYASQVKDRIADTASSYADSAMGFADDARRAVTERSARLTRQTQATLQSSMQRVLREQPLAVAVAGLAAGAAVAALFPSTEIENRALGGAHEKLKEAAERAGEKVRDAAGKAGERLKSAAEERGLTTEGLKEVASEVAGTFKDAMSGEPENRSGASQTGVSPVSSSSQSFGMEQNKPGSPSSPTTQPLPGGRSMR
jgi:ElaB/YqjD/DUF883 family membrane-anchored ribosome-binding protein